jgi:Tfp pilus assembly protein PilO
MEKTRQISVAAVVLALIVIVVLVYEWVMPRVKEYQQMSDTLRAKQAQVSSDRIIADSLKTEMITFNKATSDLETTSKFFDTKMRDGSHIVLLGLKSAATEVTITSIKPGNVVEKPNYLELPLDITATGNYLNVVAFFTDLESLPNLTDIRMFKIVAAPTVDDDSNVTVNMSIVIFAAKTPTEAIGLDEISNWALGRDNVFEPLDGFGQVSASAQSGGGAQTPGTSTTPALPQVPQESFNSGALKRVNGAVPLPSASSAILQK